MSRVDLSLVVMSFWVILGNVWHGVLLSIDTGGKRPSTISEHAVLNDRLLLTHRLVHTLPLIMFAPVILWFLIPEGHMFATAVLFLAALFDSIEVLALNKRTAPVKSSPNIHFVTAWLMAAFYFAYSLLISRIAGISVWFYSPVLLVCLVLAILATKLHRANRSLSMQMTYFILVSLVGVVANIKIMVSWQIIHLDTRRRR